jgi:hypothetical protein
MAGAGITRGPIAVGNHVISMRLAAGLLMALAIAVAQYGRAATIAVTAERHGDTIVVRASATLAADAATAWRVMTNYEGYPAFIPDLRTSRVVARSGRTVTVEQSGDARLWLVPLPLEITFEIDEDPPLRLQSRAVAGSLRALASRYVLTSVDVGVRLDYAGEIAPGFPLFGYLEQVAVQGNVARQFQALADEIERRAAAIEGHGAPAAH